MVTVQRFKFNSRSRQADESVATFVAELRHLAIHCEYGNSLNNMLQDGLICGINDPCIQRRLLAETAIDFAKALKIALAMETADRDAHQLQVGQNNKTVPVVEAAVHNTVGRNSSQSGGAKYKGYQNCYRCGVDIRLLFVGTKRLCAIPVGKKAIWPGHAEAEELNNPRLMLQNTNTTVTEEADEVYTMFLLRSTKLAYLCHGAGEPGPNQDGVRHRRNFIGYQ